MNARSGRANDRPFRTNDESRVQPSAVGGQAAWARDLASVDDEELMRVVRGTAAVDRAVDGEADVSSADDLADLLRETAPRPSKREPCVVAQDAEGPMPKERGSREMAGNGAAPAFPSAHSRPEVGQKRFLTAREIASLAPSEVPWVARPWAAQGALTEVEGKIKSAGKTTWVLSLCRAVLDGKPFMGQPTRKTAVLYLTEQHMTSFREALRRADLLERDDLHVLSRLNALGLTWLEVVKEAVAECRRVEASLLVVDTLPPFSGLEGDAENSAGDAQAAIAPLQALASQLNVAVIIVRHGRKGGGEVGESGRGSSAFGGAVDLLVSLRRRDGNAPKTQRVIYTLGRFDETPDDLVIDLTEDGYVALGTENEAGREALRSALRTVLSGESSLTEEELAAAMEAELGTGKASRSSVQRVREEERQAGRVHRVGGGKRGDPYRYQLTAPDFVAAQPTLLGEQKQNEETAE